MRHGKKFNHLKRTSSHRKAMLSNMASSLIKHKRINTTVPKAKALRKYVEPLITKSKTDNTNSRRMVFSYLQDKESVKELFDQVSDKVMNRPGGYTRIIKTGFRLGDNAEMCMMELVDYNDIYKKEEKVGSEGGRRRRRRRRGGKGSGAPSTQEATQESAAGKEETATTTAEEEVATEEEKKASSVEEQTETDASSEQNEEGEDSNNKNSEEDNEENKSNN